MARTALEIASANAKESREVATLKMREQFPVTASIVDELRAAGLDPKVRFAIEGDNRVGYKGAPGVAYSGSGTELVTGSGRQKARAYPFLK